MSKTAVINTIIGTISNTETITNGGLNITTITIPHTFWTGRQKSATTDYRFTFFNVSENAKFAYQEGTLVKVDFNLAQVEYGFQLKPTMLSPLGQAFEGNSQSYAINRITGQILHAKDGTHEESAYTRIGIPNETREGNSIETTWLGFTYWDIPQNLKFLYKKFNVVTIDYHIFNKEDKYDIRQIGSINVHAYPKKKEATAS